MTTLKELREEAGMTAMDLAVLADVSLSTVNRMEAGRMPVTRLIANKVLNALSSKIGFKIKIEQVENLKVK